MTTVHIHVYRSICTYVKSQIEAGVWAGVPAPKAPGAAYLGATIGREAPRGRGEAMLRPSRNHYVRGFRCRDLLAASIAELISIDTREEVLPFAQQNRRNGDVHLVD